MNTFCDGNCSACAYAEAGSAPKKTITAAVHCTHRTQKDQTVTFGDYCIRFIQADEISSIMNIKPDVVVSLIDSNDLSANLYPATKFIDMDIRVVMALENYDDLLRTDHSVDHEKLGRLFGFPVVPADMDTERGKRIIFSSIVEVFEKEQGWFRSIEVPYGYDVEEEIDILCDLIHESHRHDDFCTDRYIAVRLMENEDYILPYVNELPNAEAILNQAEKSRTSLKRSYNEDSPVLVKKARWGFINGALQETLHHSKDNSDHTRTQRIDAILTNRWLGFPIMILILFLVFEATFTLGAYPQSWIESGVDALGRLIRESWRSGWFTSLVADGLVQGVGAVIAFLPNIIILFFFLSLLEDSRYMARAAYIMDKLMHRVGLHGKSFVPMLIGFGCNVPAIMAAKNIEDKKDRTLTMLMIPFMSCSARLPVYMLFVAAFFAKYKALVMISLYAFGILLSIIFAFIMKHTRFFRKAEDDYVSELPPFRRPTWRNTGHHIWERVSDYLQKITTVILAASVIIWALEYFPASKTENGQLKENSYLAAVGKAAAPVTKPLGFNWKMNVCLITGLPAKEAIVSTMGILYHAEEDEGTLAENMRTEGDFTPATAIAFMLFVLLYFPCIATITTLRKEIGRGWAAFTVVHSLLLAWVVAFLAFHIISLLL